MIIDNPAESLLKALGLRDEFFGGNQLRKARIIKVSCIVTTVGRKRSPFISSNNSNDSNHVHWRFPPTAVFLPVHLEWFFFGERILKGFSLCSFPDFSANATQISTTQQRAVVERARGFCPFWEK